MHIQNRLEHNFGASLTCHNYWAPQVYSGHMIVLLICKQNYMIHLACQTSENTFNCYATARNCKCQP